MYKEVETELKVLENRLFSGHVKFGIEHGSITSMSITSRVDTTAYANSGNWKNELDKLFPEEKDFYGSLDFNFNFGKMLSAIYSTSFQGEQLNNRLRTNQCRSVKVVVKK